MYKKLISLFVFLCCAAGSLLAQDEFAWKIFLKDGSVYNGFISEQSQSGDVTISFTGFQYTAPKDSIEVYAFGENQSVKIANATYNNVDVLEEGDYVTVLVKDGGAVAVPFAKLERIVYPVVPDLEDVVTTKEASYTGHIVERVFGKYLKMLVDGKKRVVAENKIVSLGKIAAGGKTDISVEQSPLLDVYYLKDRPQVTGLLLTQNYADGTALFKTREGGLEYLKVSNILRTSKIKNPSFKEPEEPIEGDVVINKSPANWMEATIEKGVFILDLELGNWLICVHSGEVTVLVADGSEDLELFRFNPYECKYDSKKAVLKIKEDDIRRQVIEVDHVTKLGENRAQYFYHDVEPGFYILWNSKEDLIIPIWAY